ncbi:hypothetical protein [Daejeonella sp.]|nr:hypothetical protein [Daejeonella sp.]MDP2415570.1 hypothetical protein [Daejeonella sp.]
MISIKSSAKITAEHGTIRTEEVQTLLSKTRENYSMKTGTQKDYILNSH